ncbi:MAG: RNA-binding S4 domain-containing protein [Stellaceae bacterium]
MRGEDSDAARTRRLDQWLWFARLAQSRSLAARLIAAGAVTLNGAVARKANQAVRVGDALAVPQGGFHRSLRVVALGARRGPYAEARLLYDETARPRQLAAPAAPWEPLLADEPADGEDGSPGAPR